MAALCCSLAPAGAAGSPAPPPTRPRGGQRKCLRAVQGGGQELQAVSDGPVLLGAGASLQVQPAAKTGGADDDTSAPPAQQRREGGGRVQQARGREEVGAAAPAPLFM